MIESFQLERHKFVSGLHWQVMTGGRNTHKAEIKEIAKDLAFDLCIFRDGLNAQAGFASSSEGFAAGMLSAAAVVSKTIEVEFDKRDFLCAVELPDGRYLYVCQMDGVIAPEGDLIGTAEDIRAKVLQTLSIGKEWEMIFAPMMWGISGAEERKFLDFVPTKKSGKLDLRHKWWGLKPVSISPIQLLRQYAKFIVIAVLIGAALVGYKVYKDKKSAELAAEMARIANQEKPVEPPPHPWKSINDPASVVAGCMNAIRSFSTLWPGGWNAVSISCDGRGQVATLSLKRPANVLIKHLMEIEPKAQIAQDGQSATLTKPVVISGQLSDEALEGEDARRLAMLSRAQLLGVQVELNAAAPQPVLPGSPQTPPVPWKEIQWVSHGHSLPESIAEGFAGPGLRVTKVTATMTNGQFKWDVEGVLYVSQ